MLSEAARDYGRRYAQFLSDSPTSFHAAQKVASILTDSDFFRVDQAQEWPATPGKYFVLDEGALLAWVIPSSDAHAYAVFGAHTDSPGLKLKPTPHATTLDGWGQLLVEIYGGALYNSWLDRELEVAGVLYAKDGSTHLVRTGPIARIPQLAIHLDRGVNQGLTLDPQRHLQPVWTVDDPDADIMAVIAASAQIAPSQIAASDLFCVPTQRPDTFGNNAQFLAAGRQDNLSSVYAGLEGFLQSLSTPTTHIPVLAFFDHEEVGSSSRTGAAGPLLESLMRRTSAALGKDNDRMVAASLCISADAGHSVHPNYAGMHDPDTHPVAGRGPVAKLNANQRYASTASGVALWEAICTQADIPHQSFVSRNDVPCGSTIGPITATRTGLRTVDVGVPMLSMHSAREMIHIADAWYLARAAATFFSDFSPLI